MKVETTGVIANYNQGAYVLEAIQSLASQVDELIVVDDASTDISPRLLSGKLPVNTRVFFNSRNSGVSMSLNRAISKSQGKIILLQGGDDISLPGRAAAQTSTLARKEVVLSYSRPIVIGANGKNLSESVAPEFLSESFSDIPQTLLSMLSLGNTVCAPSVAFRKSDFEEVGGFNPSLLYLQDFDLWLSLMRKGIAVRSDEYFVNYRKHKENLSGEGNLNTVTRKTRFEFELIHCLRKAVENTPPRILSEMLKILKIEPSREQEVNKLLLLITLPLPTYRRLALEKLISLQDFTNLREELYSRGFDESGIKKLIHLL